MSIEERQLTNFACAALLLVFVFVPTILAQDPQLTQLNAPPPFRTIPKAEKSQLEQADNKQRLHLTIDFTNDHLAAAEKYTSQQNYEAASSEIGIYYALLENLLTYLASEKHDSNKTRDLYKHLEMVLREHGPRLTAMRRITPIEFAVWIKEAEDFARDGRTEALNSFYGHTVVRESPGSDTEKRPDKPKEEPTPKSKTP